MWKLDSNFRYVELQAPQKSPAWHAARKRVTASNIEKVLDVSRFGTSDEYLDEILGRREKSFSPEAIARMDLGNRMEDPIRQFHVTRYPGAQVVEPSLCIPLRWWNLPLSWISDPNAEGTMLDKYGSQLSNPLHPNWFWGGSPDGILTCDTDPRKTWNLEIKYSEKGYDKLIKNVATWPQLNKRITPGPVFGPMINRADCQDNEGQHRDAVDYYEHVWRSHWYQQLTCMAANGRMSSDYVVGSKNYLYTETIPFDSDYWIGFLYPAIISFIVERLIPEAPQSYLDKFKTEVESIIETCQLKPEHELRIDL